jgi:hypothetical protein
MIKEGDIVFQQIPIDKNFIRHWYQVTGLNPPTLRCLGASSNLQPEITNAFGTAGNIFQVRNFNGFKTKPSM